MLIVKIMVMNLLMIFKIVTIQQEFMGAKMASQFTHIYLRKLLKTEIEIDSKEIIYTLYIQDKHDLNLVVNQLM